MMIHEWLTFWATRTVPVNKQNGR